jgi:16S rRNA (guanine966-N2)-methyltransferase
MRVVAGKWRGRKLIAPAGDATRPTTDRVKEALFSIMGDAVHDARIVDLCCGSGGLGIEALSRGAAEVVFVDLSWQAVEAVKRNLEACGAVAESYTLLRRDALTWLGTAPDASTRRTIILSDPPYAGDLPADIWQACCESAATDRIDLVILEHASELELAAPPPGWRVKRRRYGATALSIMERTND